MSVLPGVAIPPKQSSSQKRSRSCPVFTVEELAVVFQYPNGSYKNLKTVDLNYSNSLQN